MEPKLPLSASSPEMASYRQKEVSKPIEVQPFHNQETLKPASTERNEMQPNAPAAGPVSPVVSQLPVIPPPQADAQIVGSLPNDNPINAADEDLIEKEWVDKAKRIVEETRSDPYQQEDKVSKLQADYL